MCGCVAERVGERVWVCRGRSVRVGVIVGERCADCYKGEWMGE